MAEQIDRFIAAATDPATDPSVTWDVIQVVHVGHNSLEICTADCITHPYLILGPVRESRAAIEEIDAWFAANPPSPELGEKWLVRK